VVQGCVGDHVLRHFYTLYVTGFGTYITASLPQDKTFGGGGREASNRQIAAPISFCRLLLRKSDFCNAFREAFPSYTVIRLVSISAKFRICAVVGLH
jgi:hypothetical protein